MLLTVFKKHEACVSHLKAVKERDKNQPAVDDFFLKGHLKSQQHHTAMLLKQLSTLLCLARNGLAIRGHSEDDGNLKAILELRGEDCAGLKDWTSSGKYLSHDIINEQINLMGQALIRDLLNEIRAAKYFSVLADEVRDISNQEQLCITIRWVDDDLRVHEDLVGLVSLPKGDANTIAESIKDVLIRLSLPISLCRGQGYDGAATMSGVKNGVAAKIRAEEPRALYVHCLAHCLNLVLQDASRQVELIRDALELCMGLSQLINWSQKRFEHFKAN